MAESKPGKGATKGTTKGTPKATIKAAAHGAADQGARPRTKPTAKRTVKLDTPSATKRSAKATDKAEAANATKHAGKPKRSSKRKAPSWGPLVIAGTEVAPGTQHDLMLSQSNLPSAQELPMRVVVLHGHRKGPGLWLSAAIHGDEICGVDIIRRVLKRLDPATLHGTLYAVPIVNTFGFLEKTRTLPDGRDLNRSFPGSAGGSLASRLAHLFLKEIVDRCDYGIDLHTAGNGRDNLPQIRADLDDELVNTAARAFGAPVMIHSKVRDGSLRASAADRGRRTLLFEGGPPLRFDEHAISVAERGVLNVMALLRMGCGTRLRRKSAPQEIRSSTWIRAPKAGIAQLRVRLGDKVAIHDEIGLVAGPLGRKPRKLRAPSDGIIIGVATNPVVYQGDALVHLGRFTGTGHSRSPT